MKKKACIGFAIFLTFMIIMTIVSRAIYTNVIPCVRTQNAEIGILKYTVKGTGVVEQTEQRAVFLLDGLRITRVCVRESEEIEEGTVLFWISRSDLEETVKTMQEAVDAETLRIMDLKANADRQAVQKKQDMERASWDYENGDRKTQREIEQARREAARAWEEENEQESLEEAVQKMLESSMERSRALNQEKELSEELSALRKELNNAAQGQNSVSENDIGESSPSGQEELILQLQNQILQKERELGQIQDTIRLLTKNLEESARADWENRKKVLSMATENAQRNETDLLEKREETMMQLERAKEDANLPMVQDSSIEIRQMDLKLQEDQLKKYRQILEEGVMRVAEYGSNAAKSESEDDVILSSDSKDAGENNSNMEEIPVISAMTATVIRVNLLAGGRTTDEAGFLFADMEKPFLFTSYVSGQEAKKMAVGDVVNLSFPSAGGKKSEALIVRLYPDSTQEGMYKMEAKMDFGALTVGEMGDFSVSGSLPEKTVNVPVDAVHTDGIRKYVYVLCTNEGFLGEEWSVERRNVEVLEQNERYAALNNSALTNEDKVVVQSSKELTDGVTVRLLLP